MLHSLKQLHGNLLGASGEKFGHVADCYFDDQNWMLGYVAVETHWWNPPRCALLAPNAFAAIPNHRHTLQVKLTRQQIEKGPTLQWLGGSLSGLANYGHLRSARSFFGFQLQSGSQSFGSVGDLLMDGESWQIRYLAVAEGRHWFLPGTFLLSTRRVLSVDWEHETVNITSIEEDIGALRQRAFVHQ